MLTSTLTAVLAASTAAVGLLTAPPPERDPGGDLWGSVSCADTPSPACDLGAGSGGGDGRPAPAPDPDAPDVGGPLEDRRGGGAEPADGVSCSYVISDFQPPAGGVVGTSYPVSGGEALAGPAVVRPAAATVRAEQPDPGEDGAWYLWRCSGEGFRDSLYRPPVWIADGAPTAAGPSPAQLAEVARGQLRLPESVIAASPPGDQLVNLPTWLWLATEWEPVESSASVPGVMVTARAVPVSVRWDMGEGSTVVCRGPGTPYVEGGDPAGASPDCGHTYRRSSAGRPGEAFPVSATVSWTVAWAGAGDSGGFPGLTTTSGAAFRVAESQALVTGGG